MSNPVKMDDTEEGREDSDEQWSDEESAMREIVLGLPAIRISSESVGVSSVVEEEEACLNEQAVVAAQLFMAAAEEAVMKEKSDGKKKKKKKKVSRPRKTMKINDEASGSGKGGEAKNPKKKASELTNTPRGPPVCYICGRRFGSLKAVFGHMRSHKDRKYQGFHPPPPPPPPPPKFSAAAEGFTIPGPNSAFVLVAAGRGRSGGLVTDVGGGAPGGDGGRGLGVDLNVDPVEEDEQEVTESGPIAKFDLNKSPPKDEEEEDKAK